MTMTANEWAVWRLDQKINRVGLPIDLVFVDSAIAIDTENRARLTARAAALMGVDNPNSRDQFVEWLAGEDVNVDTLRKADVAELRAGELAPNVREALEIRAELSKTSIKKYYTLRAATGTDGRLRGCFQFNGAARTGRWAGRIFQPQNLPSGSIAPKWIHVAREVIASGDYEFAAAMYPNVADLLSSGIRTAVAAPKGKKLVVADLASIETVMIAWAARCPALLAVFREGRDAYKEYATRLFGVPYDKVTPAQRKYSKPPVLGCGYMLGAKGLVAYAKGYGVTMGEDEAKAAVDAYRTAYPEVVRFWYAVDRAMKTAIESPGQVFKVGVFKLKKDGDFLLLKLPSGRCLGYYKPEIDPDGRFGPEITYMGTELGSRWTRLSTHPGKITENIIQAIARDLLAEGLINADADPGLEVVGHVHDEILALADENDDTATDRLIAAMCRLPAWAADAPVGAAGWSGLFYRKD